jgi:fibrillarin-like pre-rRNA processing protein
MEGSNQISESRLKGIYELKTKSGRRLYTISLNPSVQVYGETIIRQGKDELREWNPKKSKLAASIIKGISQIGIMPGKSVLYLGCATGTTCSHVSDILGAQGFLYAVDFAPRVMRDFVFLAEQRLNIVPILADCNHPEEYSFVPEVDVIFQDIAQRNQVEIFFKNIDKFLKKGGVGLLAVKARSVDVTKDPRVIFKDVRRQLEARSLIVDYKELAPLEKDHCLFVIKKI